MSKWFIYHTDKTRSHVECDSVSVAGSVMGFLKHSKIATPDGKIQGIPVAFIDLSNPTICLVEMQEEEEGDDATVLAIV